MKSAVPLFRPRAFLRLGTFVCLLPLLATGCHPAQDAVTSANNSAALPGSGVTEAYRVRAAATAFYHISPLQASGPDEQLKKDTEVTMVRPSRAFSRVKTSNGETGYVATEDIGPATAGELASASMSIPPDNPSVQAQLERQRQAAARGMGGDGYTIPPEAGNQEKLPEPDARSAGPKVNTGASATPTPDPLFHH